ncbi:MAG: Rieske (2Fe-2S) protein [Flavobacteriaceae bacterium]|nr:Rieske (2Fe-2S) protein [Flavobacteriaceae bacterium]
MKRKEFIKKCGYACLGSSLGMLLLESCVTANVTGKIVNTDVFVPLDSFKDKKYIIVENQRLQFPIFVSRISKTEFSAVLMECSHQGAELQAFGDTLECAAHGSKFDSRGIVKEGPAYDNLPSFPVRIKENQLKISLKNV